jgi:transporter family protein
MSPQVLGLIVGGLLPALFYGTSSVFAKTSSNAGMSVGGHLFFIGIAVSLTGVLFNLALPGTVPSVAAAISSSMQGFLWALGTGCVVLGLLKYQAPLAKLVPLYNMNTLITAGLALIIFAEWRDADPTRLFIGAGLIVVGGILVSGA